MTLMRENYFNSLTLKESKFFINFSLVTQYCVTVNSRVG